MNRKANDGIEFESTVYLLEGTYRKFPVYMQVLQLLAIVVGSFSFMSIFTHCFDLQFIYKNLFIGIVVSACVFFLLFFRSSYDLIKFISVLAIYGQIIYHYFKQVENGFYILENAVIKRASSYYGFKVFRFVANEETALEDMTILLLVIIIPIIGFMALCILRDRLSGFCHALMIIPVVISFAMGITPREKDMITYILVILFMYLSNGFIYKSSGMTQKSLIYRVNIRTALIVCLLALMLFNGIKLFVSEERYESYDKIKTVKSDIQEYMINLSFSDNNIFNLDWNIGSSGYTSSGGLSYGELGRVDKVNFDDSEHLIVKAPLDSVIEGLYLKGYVGSVYTGENWEIHGSNKRKVYEDMMENISEGFEPAIGASFVLNKEPYSMYTNKGNVEITYKKNNINYVLAPYFTSFEGKVDFEYDLGAISKDGKVANVFDYRYDLSNLLNYKIDIISYDKEFQAHLDNERIYRSFVYDTYTKLPEEGLGRLKRDFSKENVGEPANNLQDAISYIKAYLDINTRYTLSPGRLPDNKDFVEYFLYENRLGYCAHYASAGVLMLRAMGYPARYVEGYAITRSDLMNLNYLYIDDFEMDQNIEISVKDSNAHAWVEVYVDRLGWIPVEFTTASSFTDFVDILEGNIQSDEKLEEPSVRPTRRPPAPTDKPKEEVEPSKAPVSHEEDNNSSKSSSNEEKEDSNPKWQWFILTLIILAFILYRLYLLKKKKDISEENHSKRALVLYRKIERLFAFNKFLPKRGGSLEDNEDYVKEYLDFYLSKEFEDCMEYVRKARFGGEQISLVEYMQVEKFYKSLEKLTYEKSSAIKRMLLRLIL